MNSNVNSINEYLKYIDRDLHIENVSCKFLAKKYGTPIYCYSLKKIEDNFRRLRRSFSKINPMICYAVKANYNGKILSTLSKLGSGADVVSQGELKKSLDFGIRSDKIVFSGVGKTTNEIRYAIKKGIKQINVESEEEIHDIVEIGKKNQEYKINISIRVNPNVDAKTHEKISTGRSEDKFGISIKNVKEIFQKFRNYKFININGLSMHIGSQIVSIRPFEKAFKKMRGEILRLEKFGFKMKTLDLGGGIGINYNNNKVLSLTSYAKCVEKYFGDLDVQVILEPGRYLVGSSGIIISKVIRRKKGNKKNFLIINSGMNNLIRPSLYNAFHKLIPANVKLNIKKSVFDIVGPICESSDIFGKDILFQDMKKNELIIICTTGAYGSSMASDYNLQKKAKEIFIENKKDFLSK